MFQRPAATTPALQSISFQPSQQDEQRPASITKQPSRQSLPAYENGSLPGYQNPNQAPGSNTPYYMLSPKDLEEAAQSDPNAKFIYALALLNGYQGCQLRFGKGKELMLALAKDSPESAGGLCAQGKILEQGWVESGIKNIVGALEKYNQAKEMGYVPAEYLYCSRNNRSFDVNQLIAIASQHNYGPAKSELAHLYYYGAKEKRIEQNITTASSFAYKAADTNHDLYGRIIAGYCLYNYGSSERSKNNKIAEAYFAAAKEQVTGTWTFAEKRLEESIANAKYDEIPECLRCVMQQWCGCWCVSSLFYPKVVPNRVTNLTGEELSLGKRLCMLPVAFAAGMVVPQLAPSMTGSYHHGSNFATSYWRTAPGTSSS